MKTSPEEYIANLAKMAVETFSEHKIRKRSEGRWLLQRPHSDGGWDWTYSAEIVCLEGYSIFVGGDVGPMVFAHGPKHLEDRVRWIGKELMGQYVHEKAAIGTLNKLSSSWDPGVAEYQLDEMIDERFLHLGADGRDPRKDGVLEAIEDAKGALYDGQHAVDQILYERGGEWMDDFSSLGVVPSVRVFYAWAALARLCILLDQEMEEESYVKQDAAG